MARIKAVLFDVGNVIIPWSQANLFRKIFPDPERLTYFLTEVVPFSWHDRHDAGVSFADNRAERLKLFPQFADELLAYDTRFEEMLGDVVPETIAVIEELHALSVPLYALTNMPAEKAELVFSKIPVFSHFQDVIISAQEKLIKPDPRLYDITLQRIGYPAEAIFFTDDSPKNIAAAQAKGFVTHPFDDPKALRPALVAAGVLS
ncbi:MAG TPA: HAD family phosphatase [Asticcacaulis sp.]|nr:HAD family phosphatase [Asticcacaulis sp.]